MAAARSASTVDTQPAGTNLTTSPPSEKGLEMPGKVIAEFSMSLDGFIAGPNDGPENGLGDGGEALFAWYSAGEVEYQTPGGDLTFQLSAESKEAFEKGITTLGAIVTGRRTFDITDGWGGRHTLDVPVVVLTHAVPEEWVARHPDAPFTFVTEGGVERAIEEAHRIAGDGDVAVSAASITQQALRAGLLDEIGIDLVPVVLGGGVRLFAEGGPPVQLEKIAEVDAPGVTHLRYRVAR